MIQPTKIKFTNSPYFDALPDVVHLPAKHYDKLDHHTASTGSLITYKFDNDDTNLPIFLNTETWFSLGDLDELVMFLKAAKKRIAKVKAKRDAAGF